MAEEVEKPDEQPAMSIVPVACIMVLRELLLEIKLSNGKVDFDSLSTRITNSLDRGIAKGHPSSADLVRILMEEVRGANA